jgi:hypothetical protein
MFLPVLFVRDMGVAGWIVFAVPNVIGAAAMGWILSRPGQSEKLVREHGGACQFFSVVTIAFHVFFVLWFVPRLVGLPAASLVFPLVAIYLLITAVRSKVDLPAAAVVWLFSLAMLALFLFHSRSIDIPPAGHSQLDAAWLAPVCVFGFLLCPYLDLTFHRARQATSVIQARVAFSIGFGVCFLVMILFTLLYAATLIPLLMPNWHDHLRPALGLFIAAHMILQAAFTISLHTRSLIIAESNRKAIVALIGFAQIAIFVALAVNLIPRYHGLDAGEVVYLLFMGFYAVVFPAYVWNCMIVGRDGRSGASAAKVRAMLLGTVVAVPMLWMGFVEHRMAWLLPGMAAVLLSRFTVPKARLLISSVEST